MKTLFTDILMNEYLIITVTDNHFFFFLTKSWPPSPLIANSSCVYTMYTYTVCWKCMYIDSPSVAHVGYDISPLES